MKNNEFVIYEQIRQYLDGELQGTALADFEQNLQDNPQLAKEVQLHKDLHLLVEKEGEKEQRLRATLDQIHQQQTTTKVHTFRHWRQVATIAAAIVFLIGSFCWFQNMDSNKIQHDSLNLAIKGSPNAQELEKAYNQGDFERALPLILDYLKIYPEDCTVKRAKGVCELELEHYNDSNKTFEAIEKDCVAINVQKYLDWLDLKSQDFLELKK